MKLQIQAQSLRFRIDEKELAHLLADHGISEVTLLPNGERFVQSIKLVVAETARLEITPSLWCLMLPKAATEFYLERLPCRDAMSFVLGKVDEQTLTIHFEVDVRDSVRQRSRRLKKP